MFLLFFSAQGLEVTCSASFVLVIMLTLWVLGYKKNVSFIIWVGTVIQVQQYFPQEIRRLYLLFFCIQYCWWEVLCQCNSRISSLSSMSPSSSLFFSLTFFILSFELLALRLSFVLMDIGWSCTYLRMVITFISRSCLAFCMNSHILGVDSFIRVVCGPPF